MSSKQTTVAFSIFLGLSFVGGARGTAYAGTMCVDADSSRFRIHVGSAGLFSAFGHDHLIEARGIKGCADVDTAQVERSSVSLIFSAAAVTVLDPDHPGDRPKVQQTMETEVLKVQDFPEIQFKSERVRQNPAKTSGSARQLIIEGPLTIRGRTANVSIPIVMDLADANNTKVTGRYSFKQSTFGITPVRVMGGAVRVKDELQVEFDLQMRAGSPANGR